MTAIGCWPQVHITSICAARRADNSQNWAWNASISRICAAFREDSNHNCVWTMSIVWILGDWYYESNLDWETEPSTESKRAMWLKTQALLIVGPRGLPRGNCYWRVGLIDLDYMIHIINRYNWPADRWIDLQIDKKPWQTQRPWKRWHEVLIWRTIAQTQNLRDNQVNIAHSSGMVLQRPVADYGITWIWSKGLIKFTFVNFLHEEINTSWRRW